VIKNGTQSQGEKKIQKPGETRRKSQKPAPGTRRFFNQKKSLKTRSLLAKPGGLAALVGVIDFKLTFSFKKKIFFESVKKRIFLLILSDWTVESLGTVRTSMSLISYVSYLT